MTIAKLLEKYEKYGLSRRKLDYYSSKEVGLIPCKQDPVTKIRSYDEESEKVIKKMIILRDLGFSSQKIKECIMDASYFTVERLDEHIATLEQKKEQIEEMIRYAKDMRDTNLLVYKLDLKENMDDPMSIKIITQTGARITRLLSSPDKMAEYYELLPDDLSTFSMRCEKFITSMDRKREQGIAFESEEVQNIVDTFYHRILKLFGIAVYILFENVRDIDSSVFELEEDDLEEFELLIKVFSVCAKWCREAKTIETILDFEQFTTKYKKEIEEMDQLAEESTVDGMKEMLEEICKLPYQIDDSFLHVLYQCYCAGVDAAVEQYDDIQTEDIDKIKATAKYIYDAAKCYFEHHRIEESVNP